MTDTQLYHDLNIHLRNKLRKLLIDHGDTCSRVDMEDREIVLMVMSALMFEIVAASTALDMDEETFGIMCLRAYADLYEQALKTVSRGEEHND